MQPPQISIVIPVFNERDNLVPLVTEIRQAFADRSETYEVIFVDDGSDDGSDEVLRAVLAEDPYTRALRLTHHRGQSSALGAGFREARGAIVVTLDGDLQNDPADIPKLIDVLGDHDLVSGIRVHREDDWVRRLASKIANRVRRWVLGDSITDIGCSLKAYRSHWLRDLPLFEGMHRFLPGFLENLGARIVEVPVRHRPRIHGESKYTISNRLCLGLADLAGCRWLQSRWLDTGSFEEVTPPRDSGALETSSAVSSRDDADDGCNHGFGS